MSCKLSDKCDNVFACNILRPNVELLGCSFYKPKKPMTNEEWLCGLSTEEKATFLAIQIRLGVEFYRTNDERYQNHDWWGEWLRQPHQMTTK